VRSIGPVARTGRCDRCGRCNRTRGETAGGHHGDGRPSCLRAWRAACASGRRAAGQRPGRAL